ncbi:M23 family metallopeptidase [Gracilimonas sp.]|uniref:M23 family metallopeptidase n=1 Tax=Gracilimonas sp. TaxID=1974203 RepID=UPI0032EF02BD
MRYTLFLFFGALLIVGCKDFGMNSRSVVEEFKSEGEYALPNQVNVSWWEGGTNGQNLNKMSVSSLSREKVEKLYQLLEEYSSKKKTEYVAFLSKKKEKSNGKVKFKYRYFKLKPHQKDLEAARGEKTFYYHIYVDPADNEIYQILAVIIPNTEEQIASVKEWGGKLNGNSSGRNSSNSKNKILTCTYEETLSWEPLCGCFSIGTVEVCAPADDAIDDGGSGGTGGGCYYSGGDCDEAPYNPPGGSHDDPDQEVCPTGQVEDADGNCIDGEVPCVGNPVKNPRIAEQTNSGIEGGRFGNTRNRPKPHLGIDIKNDVGSPFFSMYSGTVVSTGHDPEELGYWVTVQISVDGEYYTIQYNHLKKNGRPGKNTQVNPGDVIGIQGLSGNLERAIFKDYTDDPHTHIVARKRISNGWNLEDDYSDEINPEQIITTKFDNNGNPVAGTDC